MGKTSCLSTLNPFMPKSPAHLRYKYANKLKIKKNKKNIRRKVIYIFLYEINVLGMFDFDKCSTCFQTSIAL